MMEYIAHEGVARRSGRYPWGSGENPQQRTRSFKGSVEEMKSKGLSEAEVAKAMGITTTVLRQRISLEKAQQRASDSAEALRLKDKGYSNIAIGERMGLPESTVRLYLKPATDARLKAFNNTAELLENQVAEKKYIDVGAGTESFVGVSRTTMDTSISMLKDKGYQVHKIYLEQVGNPGKYTTLNVLTDKDTDYKELYKNRHEVKNISGYTEDSGRTMLGIEPPRQISKDRIMIRYTEDGGSDKDGVIELRKGVDELSLGESSYSQVRIAVDGGHYMKGMAMYTDDIPSGFDVIYNTNKSKTVPPEKVYKSVKDDPDNPFGSIVRQKHYIDADGKTQLSALNIVGSTETAGEEGSWGAWSKTLSSQVLSKQSVTLAKQQLDIDFQIRQDKYNEIMALTNPAIKKRMLNDFAEECDSNAVHLKAAALPRQQSHVILPLTKIKENEIYAPNYDTGEDVVLIRYPHGGIFEIPQLKVNNNNRQGKSLLKNAEDAVGIHPKVAEILSGADFDGDTVLVIPNPTKLGIKRSEPLEGLKDFDPKVSYKGFEGMPKMTSAQKGQEMGLVSNLITDMTLKGATADELVRAVKHSMVVIDAEKHGLNYKQSYLDNGVKELKLKYQNSARGGSSTLISKASGEKRIPVRKEGVYIKDPVTGKTKRHYVDSKTGEKLYTETPETYSYVNKNGKVITKARTISSTKMYEEKNAFNLSSGTAMENTYAQYANDLKNLANTARLKALDQPSVKYDKEAKAKYSNEVASLDSKLRIAESNAPLERQAQIVAHSVVSLKKQQNPNLEASDIKKIKGQAINEARLRVGASKQRIDITNDEWEAIQAGAISNNKLEKILNNTDNDVVAKLATPKEAVSIASNKQARIKAMSANGATQAEIASALGISTTTVREYM